MSSHLYNYLTFDEKKAQKLFTNEQFTRSTRYEFTKHSSTNCRRYMKHHMRRINRSITSIFEHFHSTQNKAKKIIKDSGRHRNDRVCHCHDSHHNHHNYFNRDAIVPVEFESKFEVDYSDLNDTNSNIEWDHLYNGSTRSNVEQRMAMGDDNGKCRDTDSNVNDVETNEISKLCEIDNKFEKMINLLCSMKSLTNEMSINENADNNEDEFSALGDVHEEATNSDVSTEEKKSDEIDDAEQQRGDNDNNKMDTTSLFVVSNNKASADELDYFGEIRQKEREVETTITDLDDEYDNLGDFQNAQQYDDDNHFENINQDSFLLNKTHENIHNDTCEKQRQGQSNNEFFSDVTSFLINPMDTNGIKGHEDLRQDKNVKQRFDLVSSLQSRDGSTNDHDLNIQQYTIAPIIRHAGFMNWVPSCDMLHRLIQDYNESKIFLMYSIFHRQSLTFSKITSVLYLPSIQCVFPDLPIDLSISYYENSLGILKDEDNYTNGGNFDLNPLGATFFDSLDNALEDLWDTNAPLEKKDISICNMGTNYVVTPMPLLRNGYISLIKFSLFPIEIGKFSYYVTILMNIENRGQHNGNNNTTLKAIQKCYSNFELCSDMDTLSTYSNSFDPDCTSDDVLSITSDLSDVLPFDEESYASDKPYSITHLSTNKNYQQLLQTRRQHPRKTQFHLSKFNHQLPAASTMDSLINNTTTPPKLALKAFDIVDKHTVVNRINVQYNPITDVLPASQMEELLITINDHYDIVDFVSDVFATFDSALDDFWSVVTSLENGQQQRQNGDGIIETNEEFENIENDKDNSLQKIIYNLSIQSDQGLKGSEELLQNKDKEGDFLYNLCLPGNASSSHNESMLVTSVNSKEAIIDILDIVIEEGFDGTTNDMLITTSHSKADDVILSSVVEEEEDLKQYILDISTRLDSAVDDFWIFEEALETDENNDHQPIIQETIDSMILSLDFSSVISLPPPAPNLLEQLYSLFAPPAPNLEEKIQQSHAPPPPAPNLIELLHHQYIPPAPNLKLHLHHHPAPPPAPNLDIHFHYHYTIPDHTLTTPPLYNPDTKLCLTFIEESVLGYVGLNMEPVTIF